jgi:hypothetical protein
MDEVEELRRLRSLVLERAHDLANSLGIALNYAMFLGEDLGGGDPDHPVWSKVAPIEAALRRSAELVRALRDETLPPTLAPAAQPVEEPAGESTGGALG